MFAVAILCPVLMIGMGLLFRNAAPKKINYIYGYRTTMSMKNRDTWEFAHRYIGRLSLFMGLLLLVPSAVPMLFLIDGSEELIATVSLIIAFVGLAVLFASVFQTERVLKKTFDKHGNRIVAA